jgi:hypothetical protein
VEPHQVRDPILASWWRSRGWNVPADRIELSYVRDPDLDTPLARGAMPVLRHLRENVDGQPISVILTDPAGLVLARLTRTPAWSAASTRSSWPRASAAPRNSPAPTASAPRWRAAGRRMSSATSTTRRTWRTLPAPVCRSTIPPLRHHAEDVPELVRFFLGRLNRHGLLSCSPEAMQLLARYTVGTVQRSAMITGTGGWHRVMLSVT